MLKLLKERFFRNMISLCVVLVVFLSCVVLEWGSSEEKSESGESVVWCTIVEWPLVLSVFCDPFQPIHWPGPLIHNTNRQQLIFSKHPPSVC